MASSVDTKIPDSLHIRVTDMSGEQVLDKVLDTANDPLSFNHLKQEILEKVNKMREKDFEIVDIELCIGDVFLNFAGDNKGKGKKVMRREIIRVIFLWSKF